MYIKMLFFFNFGLFFLFFQLTTQGFSKEYKLSVDTSDVGVGAVLLQEG
jgi:hypothetical protein